METAEEKIGGTPKQKKDKYYEKPEAERSGTLPVLRCRRCYQLRPLDGFDFYRGSRLQLKLSAVGTPPVSLRRCSRKNTASCSRGFSPTGIEPTQTIISLAIISLFVEIRLGKRRCALNLSTSLMLWTVVTLFLS